jgi:hypothetical protein
MKARLTQILPGLWATRIENPFGGTVVQTKAFLIQRSGGNVWIYASSHVKDYMEHVEELGGVTQQLINHRDEASKFCNVLEAPVFCHVEEKVAIEQKGCIVGETFDSKVHKFDDEDLIAYHTPGHARGVTSYWWKSSEGFTILFSGDTLYSNEQGRFARGPLQFHSYPGNKEDMIKSFQLFLDLDPTYVLSGLTSSEFVNKFDPGQISMLINKLKSE